MLFRVLIYWSRASAVSRHEQHVDATVYWTSPSHSAAPGGELQPDPQTVGDTGWWSWRGPAGHTPEMKTSREWQSAAGLVPSVSPRAGAVNIGPVAPPVLCKRPRGFLTPTQTHTLTFPLCRCQRPAVPSPHPSSSPLHAVSNIRAGMQWTAQSQNRKAASLSPTMQSDW